MNISMIDGQELEKEFSKVRKSRLYHSSQARNLPIFHCQTIKPHIFKKLQIGTYPI